MWDPRVWGQRGSFANPVPIPAGNPDTGPWLYARIEPSWLPYFLGAAEQLLQPSTWDTTDPDARLDAQMRAMEAIFMLGEAAPMIPVQFQFTEACGLQVSTDGGTTWSDVPGWSDFAPACFTGPAGPSGPAGTRGTDGTNGTDGAPGTYTPGIAPNPAGNIPTHQACNIAYYLSHSVVETALTQAVAKINADEGTSTFALALIALIPGVDVIEAIVVGALGAVYLKIQRDSVGDYETALANGALWDSITCAIYTAIENAGGVTSENFPSVLENVTAVAFASSAVHDTVVAFLTNLGATGLMQVQSIGVLTDADCSACGGEWCYTWDFSRLKGWEAYQGDTKQVWESGIGWHSIGGSDGVPVQYCDIWLGFGAVCHITSVHMIGSLGAVSSSHPEYRTSIAAYNVDTNVAELDSPQVAAGAVDVTLTMDANATRLVAAIETVVDSAHIENYIFQITVTGTGLCPFGLPNC